MLFVYPAVFHKEDDAYWVEFPDLEGCQTYGGTLNETMACAQEALAGLCLSCSPPPYNYIIARAIRVVKRDFEVSLKKRIFLYHPVN